ncbi:hypothetical protein K7A41_06085 [Sphingobacterium sp. InxBP1]|uniref:tetratricopeptide repeat protein n=1 Tax=Sphingobacterium sp. InxBP1 TaxID=2870328 RepID=UPI0022443E92|nr:hypothetical protein [Sphingobacterium sp. InxBP1]MCW8310784.1 hypothetical protein [Sphingobacterium sp. InxBP1]
MKYIFLIVHLFAIIVARPQNHPIKKIDSLLDKTWEDHSAAKFYPAIKTGMQALQLAQESKYDKGTAEAYQMVADALISIGLYKEALNQLEAAEKLKYYKERLVFQSDIHRLKGEAYVKLNLYDLGLGEFREQIRLLPALDVVVRKKNQFDAYSAMASTFSQMGSLDSVEKYTALNWQLLHSQTEKESSWDRVQVLTDLADIAIKKGAFDRAQHCLDEAKDLIRKYNIPVFFPTLVNYAKLEKRRGNLVKAVQYYNQALANTVEVDDKEALRDQYKRLSDFYREYKLGDDTANDYLLKYNHLYDSLDIKKQQVINLVLSHILKSNERESENILERNTMLSSFVGGGLLLAGVYFAWNVRRKRKLQGKHEDALNEREHANKMLAENNKELSEQIEENKFSNLLALAKSNNPEFLILFNELYPDFIAALKDIDPKVRSSELEFCAMAYLNFSTKNIAEYTFVTIRAVQVRKNRLRKKFNIPSDEDFNSWMREKIKINS